MEHERNRKPVRPLDREGLERLALFYAGRYATTQAKLKTYLDRKLKERGWAGEGAAPVEALVERFCELGYVDDRAFANARASALQRRGYGPRRLDQALYAAGIEEADSAQAREQARDGAWDAAVRFAERKRIGPYAGEVPDRAGREKAFAAMLRAGHPANLARKLLAMAPGTVPHSDDP